MRILPTSVLPKNILASLRKPANHIGASAALLEAVTAEPAAVMQKLGTSHSGLSEQEASARLETHGHNVVTEETRHTRLRMLGHACLNPSYPPRCPGTIAFLTATFASAW